MNKKELISVIAEKGEMTKKDATTALDTVVEVIAEGLEKGEKISLHKFGTFEVRNRAARKGHNPATGEAIDIPESKYPAFKPAKSLKDAVKQGL